MMKKRAPIGVLEISPRLSDAPTSSWRTFSGGRIYAEQAQALLEPAAMH